MLKILACLDSVERAKARRQELDIPRHVAAQLGRSAVETAARGYYDCGTNRRIDRSHDVQTACVKVFFTFSMTVHVCSSQIHTEFTKENCTDCRQ